eukprot:1650510-Karenia_brevis.AAC.1
MCGKCIRVYRPDTCVKPYFTIEREHPQQRGVKAYDGQMADWRERSRREPPTHRSFRGKVQ